MRLLNKTGKVLSVVMMTVICLLLLLVFAFQIYLATGIAADRLSQYVTSYLHQNFTVKTIRTSGGTVILKGVRLRNPPGFRQGNLAVADSIAIAPQWGDLLHGRQRFRLLSLKGIGVSLDKNGRGEWNYSQLQKVLAARKPSAEETFIKELVVKDGSLKVEGEGVQGISLQVFDLTSKGNLDSTVKVEFQDTAHNRYLVKGKARTGADAALDLTLTAPSLALQETARVLKLENTDPYAGGKGTLKVSATLLKEELSAIGDLTFTGMHLAEGQKSYPIEGALHFAAAYNLQSDSVRLQSGTLAVRNLVSLRATGSLKGVKRERDFALDLGMDEVDLGTLNFLVPQLSRSHLLLGGRLRCDALHLEGDHDGLASATGTLLLKDGMALTEEGRLLVEGVSGRAAFSREGPGIFAEGTLATSGHHEKALLEELRAPFSMIFSSKLQPLQGSLTGLSTKVFGIPLTGQLSFDAEKASPLSVSFKVPSTRLASLSAELKPLALQTTSGDVSADLALVGKGAQEFTATAKVQLSELRGNRNQRPFALKQGTLAAKMVRGEGHLLSEGDAQLSALALDGTTVNGRFPFRSVDRALYVIGAQGAVAGAELRIARLSATIPAREAVGKASRYPLSVDLDGVSVKRGALEIDSLTGRLRGSFNSDSGGSWLEGTADLASRGASWGGSKVGAAPALHAACSRGGCRGELNGPLMGGKVAATASLNPSAPDLGAAFDLQLTGAALTALAQLFPKDTALRPAQGQLDLRLKGNYAKKRGLDCRVDAKGSGIALAGRNGKALLSGAGLSLAGALSGGNLALNNALISLGPKVALRLKGEVAQALSPKRRGVLTFSVPQTQINSVIDPLVNLLPRFLQEANFDGTLAADGKLDLHEGRELLEGALEVKNGLMEIPSQKLVIAGINGNFPVSMDLSGKGSSKPPESMSFSRENYPRLLDKLRQNAGGGEVVTVGRIAFGGVEFGKLRMHLSAVNGLTQISSLHASLFGGSVLGKGFVTMQQKLAYRGDLLINDLSLKTLCNSFPNLKGYLSGRVDGVASLSGEGTGIASITGFTNFWAREEKGEKMLVSKEFLQRLSKQKLSGFFFRSDRSYDKAEIKAMLQKGELSFDTLIIQHTNFFHVRDLNVSIAPAQNRIALETLLDSIKEASVRGKASTAAPQPQPAEAPAGEFKWSE